MLLPPAGRPPPEGAAVGFRRKRKPSGPLREMGCGKRRWARCEGSPQASPGLTPHLHPDARRRHKPPRQEVQHLSQNGYGDPLSLTRLLRRQPAFRRLLGKFESFMDLSQDQEISILLLIIDERVFILLFPIMPKHARSYTDTIYGYNMDTATDIRS